MTMTTNHNLDTVAAFIDGERVDPIALKGALATDEGRVYLVELVAMREVIATPAIAAAASAPAVTRRPSWRGLAAAAVVTLTTGVAGYTLGHVVAERRIAAQQEAANKAPTATREIPPDAGTTWIETSGGHN